MSYVPLLQFDFQYSSPKITIQTKLIKHFPLQAESAALMMPCLMVYESQPCSDAGGHEPAAVCSGHVAAITSSLCQDKHALAIERSNEAHLAYSRIPYCKLANRHACKANGPGGSQHCNVLQSAPGI